MKPYLIALFFPFIATAQISVTDSFSDGDLTSNPVWAGDTAFFTVNPSGELQLTDSLAGSKYISTASGIAAEARWEIYVRLDFNPSTSNYLKLYLMSDQHNLQGPLNGYFVRIGGSSDDRIGLYSQSGTTTSLLAESTDDWLDSDPVQLRLNVDRTASDLWILSADTSGGSNYQVLGSAVDASHGFSTHLGLVPEYTKTRADKFFFDDLYANGIVFRDTIAPGISSVNVVNPGVVEVSFTESLARNSVEDPDSYEILPGIGKPDSAGFASGSKQKVILSLPTALQQNKPYLLVVDGVEDRFGNKATDTSSLLLYQATEGDIVINEIMADPTPVVGVPPNALPEREYLELYNTTSLPVNLSSFILSIGNDSYKLPDYVVPPDQYVLLTKDDAVNEFPPNLPVLGLGLGSTALNNSGTTISLYSLSGKVISTVSYEDHWYDDPNKESGGWSLEQIDPENKCGGNSNWTASLDPSGGTPGRPNSVAGSNPDTIGPRLLRLSIASDSTVVLHFSESIIPASLSADAFEVTPELIIAKVEPVLPAAQALRISFTEAIDPNELYQLILMDTLRDCSGNHLVRDTLRFAIPQVPQRGDLLINELLFNPAAGGDDFVEIYNYSDKVFDLSKLRVGNWDENLGQAVNVEELTDESLLLLPHSYLSLTENLGFLLENYELKKPENVVEVRALPSFPDDEGSVVLLTSTLQVIDRFSYSDGMHLQVLEDDEGVSLERISFEKSAVETDNWHSAAATAGFATPGYQNSQYFGPLAAADFQLEPKLFTPNQDGYHDLLKILYSFAQPNNLVSISIYSSNGYLVKELQKRTSTGVEGFFTWDGTDESGQLMNSGIYIVVMDYYNENGDRQVLRKTCVLSQ